MSYQPKTGARRADMGRPVSIIETAPVMKYRVQYANGCTAELTEAELDAQLTNEQPRFTFSASYACGHLIVEGKEREVAVKVRRKYADFPGQCLSRDDVQHMHEMLGRWLADRP